MVDTGSVPSAYLSIAFLAIVGILMPLTNFIMSWALRPRTDPARPHITKSYLLEGYERDHSLYPRRLSTFECGSEPIGDAMIQFHFQYYWTLGTTGASPSGKSMRTSISRGMEAPSSAFA